jgi:PAS domain S-box-containing protein
MNPARAQALLRPLLFTAVAYALTGWLALVLAIPPGYASPLFPAAGIALATTLVYGRAALGGVFVGSLATNLALSVLHQQSGWVAWLLPLAIASGALLQAAAGAALVRRFVAGALTLGEPRDVLRFFVLGALLACVVSATVGNAALWFSGTVAAGELTASWLTWWIGDALGVLIAAPICLCFIGQPKEDWRHRRVTVGLSLSLVTVLLAMAIVLIGRWDEQRTQGLFERDAQSASDALALRLQEPLHALEAMRDVFLVDEHVGRDDLRRVAEPWLGQLLSLQAMAWLERVPRAQLDAYVARVRAEGWPEFGVFDRPEGGALAAADSDAWVLRLIEPAASNGPALGVNVTSVPAPRQALQATVRSGLPVATAGFRLTQETGEQTGVVIYRALYEGRPVGEAERVRAARGAVSVALRMDSAVNAVMAQHPGYLRWCLVDSDRAASRRRLAGQAGCENAAALPFAHTRSLSFAGRQWELRIGSERAAVPEVGRWTAWVFALVGLLAAAILGALLLTVTGRARRIEIAVAERTAALRREVAERQRTEAALRESEQRFRNIFDHVPIGVVYSDLRGAIRESNPRYRQLTGYSAKELARMTVLDLAHPDDRAEDIELGTRLIAGDIPMYRRQKRYVVKDGRTVWVQTMVTALRDASGQPSRLVGVVEDITEHLMLQEAERARERAEAANRAKSDFLSRMSHELRTPLNAMLGFAQLLELDRQQPMSSKQLEWSGQIRQAGWHLLHMINDTLDLSRIESGSLKLELASLNVENVISTTRALLEQAAAQRGIIITQSLDPEAPSVQGDATRTKQILTNLLSNAVKYNIERGRVHISAMRRDTQTVEIAVTDTGQGLSEQQMSELFQPFNRLGRESSGVEGTGIGLVISQRLAELMGGSLRAHSVEGEGSTFILTLPRGVREARAGKAVPGDSGLSPLYHRRLVHYIEDNETNAEVMRGILAQRPQVTLEVSATGLDALAAIRERRPSLVLLDMHLPDIDGLELLQQLKDDPDTADIPVVVVSADAMTTRMDAALQAGAEHYLTKPVSVPELLAVLDGLLERADTAFDALG